MSVTFFNASSGAYFLATFLELVSLPEIYFLSKSGSSGPHWELVQVSPVWLCGMIETISQLHWEQTTGEEEKCKVRVR